VVVSGSPRDNLNAHRIFFLSRPSRGSVKGARRARILAIRASSPGLPIHHLFHCCWSSVFRDAIAPAINSRSLYFNDAIWVRNRLDRGLLVVEQPKRLTIGIVSGEASRPCAAQEAQATATVVQNGSQVGRWLSHSAGDPETAADGFISIVATSRIRIFSRVSASRRGVSGQRKEPPPRMLSGASAKGLVGRR
jgi:hypothetical protein